MIVYNTTFVIDTSCANVFLEFIENQWIPKALESGLVVESKILKMIEELDDKNATFSVQLFFKHLNDLEVFQKKCENVINRDLTLILNNQYAKFSTKLWVIG